MDNQQLSLFSGVSIDEKISPSEEDLRTASQRESLVKAYLASTSNGNSRKGALLKFIESYKNGEFPFLLSVLGPISKSTLYSWIRDYREGGAEALIPLYQCRRPKVSRAEDRCIRELLLDRISIGQAIFITKYFLKRKGRESPSSPATLRRWAKRILIKN